MLRTLAEVPLVWYLCAFAAAWFALRQGPVQRRVMVAAGILCCAILLLVAALNVRTAGFLVSFGANVLSIAAAHAHGQPMYHAVGGPQLYSLVYGPYTFLVYEPMLHIRDALIAVKLELLALDALTLCTMFQLLRRRGQVSWQTALALTGIAAACLLAVPAGVLGVRGDVWVVLALTIGLLAVDSGPWWLAALAVGVCCGFSVDVKASLIAEALLMLVLLWRRHGVSAAVVGAGCAAIVVAAPFGDATISLRNYAAWLALSGHRESFAGLVVANVLFAALLLLPAWFASRLREVKARDSTHGLELALFAVAFLAALVTGSKSGGGPWHLWPLLPFVLWWTAQRLAGSEPLRVQRLATALAFAALVVSARWGLRAVRMELPRTTAAARKIALDERADLLALAKSHPGIAIQLAPGATMTSDADDLRYALVWAGEPYFVDPVAAGEALKTDPALLQPLAATVGRCGVWWAVPHNEIPFSTRNNNETQITFPQVFPSSVRAAFLQGHTLVEQGRYYDLWGTAQPHGLQSTSCE